MITSLNVNWQFILFVSFGVTGIIQWLKALVKDPTNLWGYISPALCVGGAFLIDGSWEQIVMNSVLILSVSQLGYDVLVKPIKKLLGVPEIPSSLVSMAPGPQEPSGDSATQQTTPPSDTPTQPPLA